MIEITKYYDHPDADYKGNPLITYFPPCNRETLRKLMQSDIGFNPQDVTHDWEQRINYPLRLLEAFFPLDNQVDFVHRLLGLVHRNLRLRNPNRPSAAQSFYERCDSIVAGQPIGDRNASFLDSSWCCVLLGTPGTGKTATTKAAFKTMGPDLFWHSGYGAVYQLLSLHVQATTNGSGKGLAQSVYLKLKKEAQKTGLMLPFMQKMPDTRAALENAIEVLAERLNLGVLVLDELQHLFKGSGAMDEDAMEFLTGVVNKLGVVIVLIGTWKAAGLLALEPRLGRRGTNPASASFYRMPKDENWDAMLMYLLQYQYTEKRVSLTPELSERLYWHTQGIQDVVVKLLVMAQMEAIASGEEELSLSVIDRVAEEHLKLIAPACRRLRGEVREDDLALWDLEPTDFKDYIANLNAGLQLRAGKRRKRVTAINNNSQKALAVAASIAITGAASEGVAQQLAEAAVERAPGQSVPDLVAKVLQDAKPLGPKPSRQASKQAKTDAEFDKLEEDDLRKIVYLAMRSKTEADAALDARGFICRPLEELTA